MLELKNIKKDYPAGDDVVHALKGVNLQFRESEFVSILGPSGCGKTTALNIIGGLDQYTEGDLIINGVSTKSFKDRDWDAYRNHSVGFVFQSYNLIPHQTVLQNVEMALTLTGVSKSERKKRAVKALSDVGLSTQINKKPSEMSGGQMQRVAIARAIVNDPDIILADEPTGALDSETSVQVMEILKKISKDRLVVMVTHNPDLAEQYSTRIIRMLDGEITSDSKPLTEEEAARELARGKARARKGKNIKKPSMSMGTSFGLSTKNLITKKGRTFLTSFAGSIGIIGIALVYAVSSGFTSYIDDVQENALSAYPLSIESTLVDMDSIMDTFMSVKEGDEEPSHEKDAVYVRPAIYDMVDAINNSESSTNDLKAFKNYIETQLEDPESELSDAVNGVQYAYNLDMLVYTKNVDGNIIQSDTKALLQDLLMEYMTVDTSSVSELSQISELENSSLASIMSTSSGNSLYLWQEMLPGTDGETVNDLLEKQYDLVYGSWPDSYDEIVLVLDENNELDDMSLYALGLESKDDVEAIVEASLNQTNIEKNDSRWSYEKICGREYRVVLSSDCYSYDEATGLYTDLWETDAGVQYLYDNALPLKVTGIIRPNPDAEVTMLSGSIGYTSKLTEYVIGHAQESAAVQAQMNDPSTDVLTGLPFKASTGSMTAEEKEAELREYIDGLDENGKAQTYIAMMSLPTQEQLDAAVSNAMEGVTRPEMESSLTQALTEQMGMSEEDVAGYVSSMDDEELTDIFTQLAAEQVKSQYAAGVKEQMGTMDTQQLCGALQMSIDSFTPEQWEMFYDEIIQFSESTYEDNLITLGCVDLDDPMTVNLYTSTFEGKDVIADAIDEYNEGVDEISKINYIDYVGLMMSSVTTIINAISYVLTAFVAISLVVSCIMVGVITLISVQERTKEIGILRAIGASKKDVSGMFNAETIVIGLMSGVLGVLLTYLLCLPVNILLRHLTGINKLTAYLPIPAALVLILISVVLTLLSGLIPSRSAAKKDPVVALRSE